MNSSDSSTTAPNSLGSVSNRKRKADEELKIYVPSKRARFLSTYRRYQEWSLPESIIYYMAMNPKNAQVYQKLIQSCKYFFVMNPIIIIERLSSVKFDNKWLAYCNNVPKHVNVKNISCKFWITDKIDYCCREETRRYIHSIIPHIYRCDATDLYLGSQVIAYNELSFLSSNLTRVTLCTITVKDEDDSIVPLEKVFNLFPKAEKVSIFDNPDSPSITTKTVKELLEIPTFLKLNKFELVNIVERFDIVSFFAYIKKIKHTEIILYFHGSISDAYKNRVEAIIDEIIETENHEYKPPLICFYGLSQEKRNKMIAIFNNYY